MIEGLNKERQTVFRLRLLYLRRRNMGRSLGSRYGVLLFSMSAGEGLWL